MAETALALPVILLLVFGVVEFSFAWRADNRLDSATGPLIATVPVSSTGGWQSWVSRTSTVQPAGVTGVHRLYLVFRSTSTADFVNVNWFQFSR